MKLHTSTTLLKSSGVVERAQARVNMNAVAFQVLSSRLYSDKESAPIREIGCNAADAHIMAGTPDRPFEVKLPTALDPSFSIRDFGPGLSHEDVMQNYQTYFHSTKNDDDSVTGCFGLGSKSPYAYTDQFTVRSVFDGVQRTYFCAFDETGVPCTSLVAEQPASDDWPHGVEVSMPVKASDQSNFQDKAQRIFQWFRVPPKIIGGKAIDPVTYEWTVGRFRKIDNGWRFNVNDPHLIMGNVAYAFKTHNLTNAISTSSLGAPEWVSAVLSWIYQRDIVFDVPIGTVDVTASREAVEYNDHTNSALVALLIEEIKAIAAKIDSYIDGLDAVTSESINGIFDQFGDNATLDVVRELGEAITQFLSPKNKELFSTAMSGQIALDGWYDALEAAKAANRCAPHAQLWSWDGDRRRSTAFHGVVRTDRAVTILVNDRPPRASDRVLALMRQDKTKSVLVFGCADKTGWQEIPPLLENNPVPIVFKLVSSLPKPDKLTANIGMTVRRKGDNKLLNVWDIDAVPVGAIPARGFEPFDTTIKDVPDDSRYYVIRESGGWGTRHIFVPGRGQYSRPRYYFEALQGLRKAGFPVPSHLAVVTNGQIDKLKLADFGFKPLHDWYRDVLKQDQRVIDFMNESPTITRITFSSYGARPLVTNLFAVLLKENDPRTGRVEAMLQGTPLLSELLSLRDEYVAARAAATQEDPKVEAWHGFLSELNIERGQGTLRSLDFDAKLKAIQDRYPRLSVLGNEINYQSGVFDFQMMAVAMAVSPQQPVILITAEET